MSAGRLLFQLFVQLICISLKFIERVLGRLLSVNVLCIVFAPWHCVLAQSIAQLPLYSVLKEHDPFP
jgi:hypothetical protein